MITSSGVGVYLRGILPFLFKSGNEIIQVNCNVKPFSITELFFFPSSVLKQINKADIYYSPFFNVPCGIKIPVLTTIHDIIFPDMPQLFSKPGLAIRMWFLRRAIKKSSKIFTVSQFSKSRIEHHLGLKKPVIVTYSAIQSIFLDYKSSLKNIQKKEIIVFIGNIKKHKGLDYLLDAYKLAKEEGLTHKLLIIGSKDNFRSADNKIFKKIEEIGSDSVLFTGFVSDEILLETLASASLLVQPSLYEGFCLPPLEAMTLGTKTLISDIPVLKEIYDSYPVSFFESGNSIDLKNKLLEILVKRRENQLSLPDTLTLKYTFEKTASIILNNL